MRIAAVISILSVPFLLAGETHKVAPSTYRHTFSHAWPAVARVAPGDTIVTPTLDSGGQDGEGVHRAEPGNPLSGPFYITGAEPGDTLTVQIVRLKLNRDWGYTTYRLGLVALLPESIEGIYADQYKQDLVRKGRANLIPWDIDVERHRVRLREPASARLQLEYPAKPMLGCIGVAPAGDFAPTSGPSGAYGGNLDYNAIGEGATIFLPVYHPGALLYVGDGHALQGDGEALGTGIETSMEAELRVGVIKKRLAGGPRVETADSLITVGSQPEFGSSLDRALQMATTDMVRWLGERFGLEPWAAHVVIGLHAKYEVVTVAGSMALRLPKSALPK